MSNQPRTRIIIETDQPCLVLVLPLPRRVEPPRAPRRVIETTGESLPESQPSIRAARPANVVEFPAVRRAGGR